VQKLLKTIDFLIFFICEAAICTKVYVSKHKIDPIHMSLLKRVYHYKLRNWPQLSIFFLECRQYAGKVRN